MKLTENIEKNINNNRVYFQDFRTAKLDKNDRKKQPFHFDEKFRMQIIQNSIYYIKSFFKYLSKE